MILKLKINYAFQNVYGIFDRFHTHLTMLGWLKCSIFAEEPLLVSRTEGCQTPAPRGC